MMKREDLLSRIDAILKARLSLSDRIFNEDRMPRLDEWIMIEAFDDKIEGLYKILEKFYPPKRIPQDSPKWVKELLY